MTGAQIRTFFHGLIDDDALDEDLEYDLMNAAKEEIESERDWEILKKKDISQTATTGAKSLPSDFYSPIVLYVGDDTQPYVQIPYEQQDIFQSNTRLWYLDVANDSYYLLGQNNGNTIKFYYIYTTPDITSATSPVWPAKFHRLCAYGMADLFYAADQSERGFDWSPRWRAAQKALKNRMIMWDVRLKKRALENGLNHVDLLNGLAYDDLGFYIGDL